MQDRPVNVLGHLAAVIAERFLRVILSHAFVAYYYLRYTIIKKTIKLPEGSLCQRLADSYSAWNSAVRSIPFGRIEHYN